MPIFVFSVLSALITPVLSGDIITQSQIQYSPVAHPTEACLHPAACYYTVAFFRIQSRNRDTRELEGHWQITIWVDHWGTNGHIQGPIVCDANVEIRDNKGFVVTYTTQVPPGLRILRSITRLVMVNISWDGKHLSYDEVSDKLISHYVLYQINEGIFQGTMDIIGSTPAGFEIVNLIGTHFQVQEVMLTSE